MIPTESQVNFTLRGSSVALKPSKQEQGWSGKQGILQFLPLNVFFADSKFTGLRSELNICLCAFLPDVSYPQYTYSKILKITCASTVSL